MMDAGLVKRTSEGYELTNMGKIQAILLDDLVSCIVALDEHKDFWQSHDISGIPINLQKKIGMLAGSEVFKDDLMTILSTQEYFISELKMAKQIYGVSPIIVPGYAEAIACAVEKGSQVDLIVTNKVLDIIIKENSDALQWLLDSGKFRLFFIEDAITVAFTVTDRILSLGLFRQDGGYDVSSDLNCQGEKALLWGKELFDYYLQRSKPIRSI
jgi:predicted transcriptional regulator